MIRNAVRGALIGMLCSAAFAVSASAGTPPGDEPAGPVPLVPVPAGCPSPQPADVVFVGTMLGKDDITQTIRFQIDQLRAGSSSPWAIDGLIDIRFGDDYRFLVEGEQYLVGAGIDSAYGVLSSAVRPPELTFGGNDVIGIDDTALECPAIDDPIRTLNVDGTSVNSGVLSLLFDDRRLLLATIAVPTVLAFVALLALVVLRIFGNLAVKGVFNLGRAAVIPVPDHRAVRVRRHRPKTE